MTTILRFAVVLGGLAVLPLLPPAAAQTIDQDVVDLAESLCGSCHGIDGRSASGEFPNLAGQHRLYLIKQLMAFRDKTRVDPVMGSMADPLDDRQIEQLADYFATRKP